MFSSDDHLFMARALRLAERGLYTTTPNPRVGCVIVRNGEVVGEGWHERTGGPHAEVRALEAAGGRSKGATVYVSLEPCSHHGHTPPCADALIEAGITRVVAAMQDPNPKVAGGGFGRLRSAGIQTDYGVLEEQARESNIGFVSRMQRGRPWVRGKTAASLDGRTALRNGVSQWITGPQARRDGHHWRARSCAVITGIGTIRHDDPQLTVRHTETSRQPVRVVVDRNLELPLSARILEGGNTLVATAVEHSERAVMLAQIGAEVLVLPDESGKVDLPRLMQELGRREMNEVLVESGNRLTGALLRAGLVDELIVYLAPHLLGDTARGMFDLQELVSLDQRIDLTVRDIRRIGEDLRIIARVRN